MPKSIVQIFPDYRFLLVIFLCTSYSAIAQHKSCIIDFSEIHYPIFLFGKVEVIHAPDHYFQDTTHIHYAHHVVLDKVNDTVHYHELFRSANSDTFLIDSYKFIPRDNGLEFFDDTDYLNFTQLAKLLFPFADAAADAARYLHFPYRYTSHPEVAEELRRDTSFHIARIMRAAEDRSHEQNMLKQYFSDGYSSVEIERVEKHNFTRWLESTQISWKINSSHTLSWKAKISERSGFYSSIDVWKERHSGPEISHTSIGYGGRKNWSHAQYVHVSQIPDEILNAVKGWRAY